METPKEKGELIDKYLNYFEGIEILSLKSYAETGKVSGSLYLAVNKLLDEYAESKTAQLKAKGNEPLTLDEVKEEVAKQFTEGKHTWYSGYLNNSIKSILMNDVAELYATQFKMEIAQLKADKKELLEMLQDIQDELENGDTPHVYKIESLIQKVKQSKQ